MNQRNEMAALIQKLADPVSRQRQRAAEEIFQQGMKLTAAVIAKWLEDEELAKLFVIGEFRKVEATVGLAVARKTFGRIHTANGSPRLAHVPPDQDAEEFELHFGSGARLDILTTKDSGGTGAIARFLQKFGEGIQQIEFLVREVDGATEILREKYHLEPIYAKTRAGAEGTRVNFFLVSNPQGGKVLIELVEAAAKTPRE
jgi:hypothetical protein